MIGAAIEVHRHLGPGFLETVYEQAMMVELASRGLTVRRQVPIVLPSAQLDLLVEDELVVELKAVERLSPIHTDEICYFVLASAASWRFTSRDATK